jgi:hypothetical protein
MNPVGFSVPEAVAVTGKACLQLDWNIDTPTVPPTIPGGAAEAQTCPANPWDFYIP